MVILYAARHRLPVPAPARWLLALGILATLAANVAHGWSNGPVGAVVAAWPAASLVGSYELLLWLIRTSAAVTRGQSPGQGDDPAARRATDLRLLQVTAAHSNGGTSALDGVEATGTLDGRCMAAAGVDLDRISVPGWPGPGGAYQPADQQEADRSAPEAPARPGMVRTKSTPRQWLPTGPAWRAGHRCRSVSSPRCSARRPAAGPVTASQRLTAFLSLPWLSRRLGR